MVLSAVILVITKDWAMRKGYNNNIFYLNTVGFKANIAYGAV